jgi:U3 small nucleolar RNA-associated protein 14
MITHTITNVAAVDELQDKLAKVYDTLSAIRRTIINEENSSKDVKFFSDLGFEYSDTVDHYRQRVIAMQVVRERLTKYLNKKISDLQQS